MYYIYAYMLFFVFSLPHGTLSWEDMPAQGGQETSRGPQGGLAVRSILFLLTIISNPKQSKNKSLIIIERSLKIKENH